MHIDPTGCLAISLLIAFGIGAVLGGIYGGISAAANGQNLFAGILIGAVVGGLTGLITEVLSVPFMLLGTFTVGAIGDMASQMILDGKSFGGVIFGTMTNSPLLALGMVFNMVISKYSSVYTLNDLYSDTFDRIKQIIQG